MVRRGNKTAMLPLTEPIIGKTYVHQDIPERLIVDNATPPAKCRRCRGTGIELLGINHSRQATCEVCEGLRIDKGIVVCHHPIDEKSRRLRLIWQYAEFFKLFRSVQNEGESLGLFNETATVR